MYSRHAHRASTWRGNPPKKQGRAHCEWAFFRQICYTFNSIKTNMDHTIRRLRSWIGVLAPPVNAPITHDHELQRVRLKAPCEASAHRAFQLLFGRPALHVEEAKEKA